MLAKVLSAGEDEAGIEVAAVTDDVTRTKASLAHRTTGNLAALSGAHGLTYMEVKLQATTCCTWSLRGHIAGTAFCQHACAICLQVYMHVFAACSYADHRRRLCLGMYADCESCSFLLHGNECMSVHVQYGVQRKKPRMTTKSGKMRHLMFRQRAEGKK